MNGCFSLGLRGRAPSPSPHTGFRQAIGGSRDCGSRRLNQARCDQSRGFAGEMLNFNHLQLPRPRRSTARRPTPRSNSASRSPPEASGSACSSVRSADETVCHRGRGNFATPTLVSFTQQECRRSRACRREGLRTMPPQRSKVPPSARARAPRPSWGPDSARGLKFSRDLVRRCVCRHGRIRVGNRLAGSVEPNALCEEQPSVVGVVRHPGGEATCHVCTHPPATPPHVLGACPVPETVDPQEVTRRLRRHGLHECCRWGIGHLDEIAFRVIGVRWDGERTATSGEQENEREQTTKHCAE